MNFHENSAISSLQLTIYEKVPQSSSSHIKFLVVNFQKSLIRLKLQYVSNSTVILSVILNMPVPQNRFNLRGGVSFQILQSLVETCFVDCASKNAQMLETLLAYHSFRQVDSKSKLKPLFCYTRTKVKGLFCGPSDRTFTNSNQKLSKPLMACSSESCL